jgi:hypothetical protein
MEARHIVLENLPDARELFELLRQQLSAHHQWGKRAAALEELSKDAEAEAQPEFPQSN